jgi:DNA polymerase III subunit gamma/tau
MSDLAGEDEVMAEDSEVTRTAQGLALYRKYRPATFAEVRGQDHVTAPLRQALRSGRINHAYLFSGPRGCGKTSSARILARSLNCVNGPTPDPCGVCDSCVALAPSGPGSIDVIEIDAASHGGVDDARDLRERAFYAPVAGRYKIYIIDEAHMVTQQGFNALLKLVEEPPPHLKFIFATTEPEKVIPTIRSRTHHYPFRLMPPSVMRELLEDVLNSEGVSFEQAVLPLVVRAGGGSARDSLSILDQLLAGSDADGIRYDRAVALLGYTDASLLDEIVDAFATADGAAVFRAVNKVIEGGHEPRRFATDMLDRFRDLIVLASVPDAMETGLLDVPPDRADIMAAQANRSGLAALTRAAEIISAALDQMRGATSPRLLLELMCAQVLLPATATGESSVLARLERLEADAANLSYSERTALTPQGRPAPEPDRPAEGDRPAARPPAATDRPASPAPAQAVSQPPAAPGSHAAAGSGAASPSATAAAPARGALSGDVLRQSWHEVLENLKMGGHRVSWVLLNESSVVSLDEGVLTLRFPRPGNVKGFAGSRHEDVLKQTLLTRFGVNVVIRAISGGDPAPGERRRPGPAGPSGPSEAAPSAPPARSAQPAQAPRTDDAEPAAGSAGPAVPATEAAAGRRAGGSAGNSANPGDSAGPADGRPAGTSRSTHPDVPFPSDDDFDPDDESADESASPELTGMALVQRELGGQIIGEYED